MSKRNRDGVLLAQTSGLEQPVFSRIEDVEGRAHWVLNLEKNPGWTLAVAEDVRRINQFVFHYSASRFFI